MPDLDAQIRAKLDGLDTFNCYDEQGCDFRDHCDEIAGARAAILAVVELHRRVSEDWTHVSETAYETGRRWALEQAVAEIAEKLGVEVADA